MNKLTTEERTIRKEFAEYLLGMLGRDYADPQYPDRPELRIVATETWLATQMTERGYVVSQKTINRYKNGESLAKPKMREAIRAFFDEMEAKEGRLMDRNPEKEDFRDEAKIYDELGNFVDGSDEYNYAVRDLDEFEYSASDDEQWEAPDFDAILEEELYECWKPEKMGFYTEAGQDYILRHLNLFYRIDYMDIQFVHMLNKLPEKSKAYLVNRMATEPETFAFARENGRGKKGISSENDVFHNVPVIHIGPGSHGEHDLLYDKFELVRKYLQEGEKPPKKSYSRVSKDTGLPIKPCSKRVMDNFVYTVDPISENFWQRAQFFADEDGYVEPKYFPVLHRTDVFSHINKLLEFTEEDWYHLYLFLRVQIMDVADYEDSCYFPIFDDYEVKEREALIWQHLLMHACNKV